MLEVTAVPSSRSSRQRSVEFPERFQGPPGMANGGFLAGTLAAAIGAPAEVTLRRPAPLDRALRIARSESGTELWDGAILIASATRADPELELPVPVSFIEACVATM